MLIEVLKNYIELKDTQKIINNIDIFIDLAKQDVFKVARSKNIYFGDFDYTFAEATKILKKQLAKTHNRAISKLYECKNLDFVIKFIVSRLLNNMRNITTNKKYKAFICPKIGSFDNNMIDSRNAYKNIDNENTLRKISKKELKNGLKKVWRDAAYDDDFDAQDFENLCRKYDFNAKEVLGYNPLESPKFGLETSESGNSQLIFLF